MVIEGEKARKIEERFWEFLVVQGLELGAFTARPQIDPWLGNYNSTSQELAAPSLPQKKALKFWVLTSQL